VEQSVTGDLARAAELIAAWDYPAARELLVEPEDTERPDHLDALTRRRLLAEVLRELGELEPARELATEVVRACRERYGDRHPATVRALAGLGMVWQSQGELGPARDCYEEVVGSGAEAGSPAGRAVLLAQAQLALLTRDEGDPRGAVRQLTVAYALHRRAYGAGDLESIRLAAELGRLHSVLADRPAARRQLAVAHAWAYAKLGEEHPLTGAIEAALTEVEAPMPSAPEPDPGEGSTARWWRRRSAPEPDPGEGSTARWRRRRSAPEELPEDEPVPPEPKRPRDRWRLAAGLATCVGTLLLTAGGVVALASPISPGPEPAVAAPDPEVSPAAPTTAAPAAPADPTARMLARALPAAPRGSGLTRSAPQDVALRDEGTSITVSWSDPTDGTGSVLISLARAGQPAGSLRNLPPGTRQERIDGLDPAVNYCVVIAVVYPQDTVAQAAQVCTHRSG
jgi:hypothetical protein